MRRSSASADASASAAGTRCHAFASRSADTRDPACADAGSDESTHAPARADRHGYRVGDESA
jgi:hypothetical protein